MNIVDRAIETLRERWKSMADHVRMGHGAAYCDGYRAGLTDATQDVEHTLRGLSTFHGHQLPDPNTSQHRVWCIPMMFEFPLPRFSAAHDANEELPRMHCPRLELQQIETRPKRWGWLVRSAVLAP